VNRQQDLRMILVIYFTHEDDMYNLWCQETAKGRLALGRSQARKADTHERVVKLASAKFRETGIDGISVADLMNEAGLTHGGFYRHFESRDELVAEAVECAMAHSAQKIADAAGPGDEASFASMIDGYLNTDHRDEPAKGCGIVALASDVARSSDRTRSSYTEQVDRHLQFIASLIYGVDQRTARRRSIVVFSALVGAMAMARAVNDEKLSQEIMKVVAATLKSST
jgi:TetR/AcrR family transcriptional regulator, transcriptional repressor for nem operon